MATYRVKAGICYSTLTQEVYEHGAEVTTEMFDAGEAEAKCAAGYLELVEEEKKEVKKSEPKKDDHKKEEKKK